MMQCKGLDVVRGVACIIAEKVEFWRRGGMDYTFGDAMRANLEGWVIEREGAMGSTVRISDIYLSEEELRRAYDLARRA